MKYYFLLSLLFITNKSFSQELFSDFCKFNGKQNVNGVEVLSFETCNAFGFEVQDVLFYNNVRTNVTYSKINFILEQFINTVNEPKKSFIDKLASFNKYLGSLNYFTLPLFSTVFEEGVEVSLVGKSEYKSNCKTFLIHYQNVEKYIFAFKSNGEIDDGIFGYGILVIPFKEDEIVDLNADDGFVSAFCEGY